MLRLLTRPRWIFRHLMVVALCVGFFFLSRWQFHRGEQSSGTVQNYGYSVEWLLFGGFVCFGWWKLLQDELHPEGKKKTGVKRERSNPWRTPTLASAAVTQELEPSAEVPDVPEPREPVAMMNTTVEIDPDDAEVVAYNAWLAELAANPKR